METSWSVPINTVPPGATTSFAFCKMGFGVRARITEPTTTSAASNAARLQFNFIGAQSLWLLGDRSKSETKFALKGGRSRQSLERRIPHSQTRATSFFL